MSISILFFLRKKPSNSYEAMQLHQRCSPPPHGWRDLMTIRIFGEKKTC